MKSLNRCSDRKQWRIEGIKAWLKEDQEDHHQEEDLHQVIKEDHLKEALEVHHQDIQEDHLQVECHQVEDLLQVIQVDHQEVIQV